MKTYQEALDEFLSLLNDDQTLKINGLIHLKIF